MITRSYVKCRPELSSTAENMSSRRVCVIFSVFKTVEMCMYVISGDKLLDFYQVITSNYSIFHGLPPYLCITLSIPTLSPLPLFPPPPSLPSPSPLPLYVNLTYSNTFYFLIVMSDCVHLIPCSPFIDSAKPHNMSGF